MDEVRNTIILLVLGIHALTDIKERQISLFLTSGSVLAGIIFGVYSDAMQFHDFLFAVIPGMILLASGYWTGGKVGYGDGLVILSLGIWTGLEETFLLLVGGLLLCSVFCGIGLAAGKLKKEDPVPFLPCLLVCFIGRLCL